MAKQNGFTVSYDGNTFSLPAGDFTEALTSVFEANGYPSTEGQDGNSVTVIAPNGDKLQVTPIMFVDGEAADWEKNEAAKLIHGGRRSRKAAA